MILKNLSLPKHLSTAFVAVPMLTLALSSCIKSEQPSMEADIETITITGIDAQKLLSSPAEAQRSILAQDNNIVYHLASGVTEDMLKRIKLDFKLSNGAKIQLAEGSPTNFANQSTVEYIVSSEDGAWKRSYKIQFIPQPSIKTTYNFDDIRTFRESNIFGRLVDRYHEIIMEAGQAQDGSDAVIFDSGNAGFKLVAGNAGPSGYPTSSTDIARSGKAVQLTTRSTGFLGKLVNKPIAAGNLFVGVFDQSKAMFNPLEATQFGRPINRKPLRFKGFYKWQAGVQYQDKNEQSIAGPSTDGKDLPQIYAVLYKNTDEQGQPLVLDGTNVLTHPNVLGIAMVTDYETTGIESSSPWASFDIPFVYKQGDPDLTLLSKNGYSLAIVFSSSRNGASFEGAVGSTLIIDDVEVSL